MTKVSIQINIIHTIDEQEKPLEKFQKNSVGLWGFWNLCGLGRDFVKEGHCN